MWSQRVGTESIAVTISRAKSRGCEVVKRTRRMPGTSPTAEKLGKRFLGRGIEIGIHVLAEELDFGVSRIGHTAGFGEHRIRRPAPLLAARVRHDAVGAKLVATFDDGDVSAMGICAGGEFGLESLVRLAIVETGDAAVPCFQALQHGWQIAIGRGAGDQRNMRGTFEDLFTFLLGNTAQDAKLFSL